MATSSTSPQIPQQLSSPPKKTLSQRLRLLPESTMGRLFRFVFGRPLATAERGKQKVGPLQGVPILGLDALGSASYGPEAALAVLLPLGVVGIHYVREVIGAIICLLVILYFSYRQTIAAYPNGGGSFTVAKENLGERAGLIAAAALLLDYILNVAVGISAGVGALESAFPTLQSHTLILCLGVLLIVTFVNLRGVRESGLAWSLPTYTFVGSLAIVLALGVFKAIQAGGHPRAVLPPAPVASSAEAISLWLIFRAFASGCTAMTGVEAVSNGVPIFTEPPVKNARRTLTLIVVILGTLLAGIGFLANAYQVGAMDQRQPNYQSVISQLTAAIVGRGPLYFVTIGSVLAVLTLSANTSFADFPRLCRLLAEDGYLPHVFANLGRRLVYTTGILILFVLSAILLTIFGGITDRLIPLFAVGAFGAFTMSQAGMVVHWRRLKGKGAKTALLLNCLGACTTAVALLIIIVAKFHEGAWITLIIIPGLIWLFLAVKGHYRRTWAAIADAPALQVWKMRPLIVVVPINGWNRVTEQALRFGAQISNDVTALHVTPEKDNEALRHLWAEQVERPAIKSDLIPPRLEIVYSPFRQLFQPILTFVDQAKEDHPEHLIAVVVPELVQPRWWEYLLYNHAAAGLKAALLLHGAKHVIVINTPWYLRELPSTPNCEQYQFHSPVTSA
jgi:amino acid transporter